MDGFLYTLPDCGICSLAKTILNYKGWGWKEVPIDNPILELGIQLIFRDRKVHAPVYVVPNEGIWIFLPIKGEEEKAALFKVVSMKSEDCGILQEPEPVTFEQLDTRGSNRIPQSV